MLIATAPTAIAATNACDRCAALPVTAAIACLTALVACTPAAANPGPDDLPPAHELVERYIDAVGGRDAIESLRTRVAELRVVTDLQWETHILEVDSLEVYGTSGGDYLIITRTADGVILEGFDGRDEWKIDTAGRVEGAGPRSQHDRWLTDPQFPLKLYDYYPDMTSIGIETWNEDTVYVVDVGGKESRRLGFDPDTGLLIRIGYKTWLEDYERVDGVLIPRRVIYGRKGGSTTYFFDAISHNERLEPTIFSLAK